MQEPTFILLYVKNPLESAAFYADLMGKPALETSPTFAMFALESGVMLGLWVASGVAPNATPPGGSELAFVAGSDADVDARHDDWKARGLRIVQTPERMDFGYTFTALDPDGHRLRVFAPGQA